MSHSIDIKDLNRGGEDFQQWLAGLESKREQLQPDSPFVQDLLSLLSNERSAGPIRAKAAFVAARLRLKEAMPVLAAHVGEHWAPFSVSVSKYLHDPAPALLEYGEASLPFIEEKLSTTEEKEVFFIATVMLYNILKDKEKVRRRLAAIVKGRPALSKEVYEKALVGLEEWK